ncbi:MAG: hypothetical protein JWP12_3892 [Bacteroidetes bacterium]|nr:hypothetical protein [Bacteroidota bacterium]
MTEEFLHHIWKFKLFDQLELVSTQNERIEIVKAGAHNFDAGPDFFNAKVRVGNTLWAGNVEVHINASDWKKHQHQKDKAYDNIILHVVFHADEILYRKSGEQIPTIEIKERISTSLHKSYLDFKSNNDWIPCEKQIANVPSIIINSTMDKLVLERLERKSKEIINSLALNNNNWEETFYQFLARNFGFKTNAEPFELLAKSLPAIVLAKHKSSLMQIEAMLFGQAGMLDKHFEDKYALTLQNEYVFLRQKFKLHSIDTHLWKFLRLRPVNFPSIRIAQFASLIFHSSHLFSKVIETAAPEELKKMFDISVSDYWNTHYVFDKASARKTKNLGDEAIKTIIVNTVVPFLFVYGKQKVEEKYVVRAIQLLEFVDGEENAVIRQWKKLKLPVENASCTQALLQLKNEYCNQKKCLSCTIGNYLLKNS